jgi:hypothetical protein
LPAMCTASPNSTVHGSRATSPQTMNGTPRALIPTRTFGATRCRAGTGTCLRSAQNVSPSTALDAQWSIDDGGGNTFGLTASQRHTTPTGIRDHQPIQPAVQIAATSATGPGTRV